MRDIRREIQELLEKTAEVRFNFIQAELQTCFTCIEMAEYELSTGNREFAQRELALAAGGIREVERYAPTISAEARAVIEEKLRKCKAALEALTKRMAS
jgi:uncharacterized protein (DUF2164 family)